MKVRKKLVLISSAIIVIVTFFIPDLFRSEKALAIFLDIADEGFLQNGVEVSASSQKEQPRENKPVVPIVREWIPVRERNGNNLASRFDYTYIRRGNDNSTRIPLRRPDRKYDPRWLAVSHTRKVAVTWIPKVMCTTVRNVMSTENEHCSTLGRDSRCSEARINKELTFNNTMYIEQLDYATVVFLRDPFERALSAYRNSITNKYIHVRGCQNSSECTFEEWVDRMKTDLDKNEHFFRQTKIAQFDKIRYKYRLRMTSKTDVNFFFTHLLGLEENYGTANAKNKSSGEVKMTDRNTNAVNATADAATTDTHHRNSGEKYGLYRSIPGRTIQTLARYYADDLELWQETLDYGTPRDDDDGDETTLYDFYVEEKGRGVFA